MIRQNGNMVTSDQQLGGEFGTADLEKRAVEADAKIRLLDVEGKSLMQQIKEGESNRNAIFLDVF